MSDLNMRNLPVTCQKCGKQIPQSQASVRPNGQIWCKECAETGKKNAMKYLTLAGVAFIVTVIFVIIIASSGGSRANSGFTYENFLKIQNGMPYTEVCDILGSRGVLQSCTEVEGYSLTMYCWEKNDGFSYANIVVAFENDKVTSKTQVGLK